MPRFFIDLHCHLRQPGYEYKETIATGTRAAAKGGFTTICCMPNTNPPLDNVQIIEQVKAIASRDGIIRVLPIACITKERKGEEILDMEKLAEAGVAGFSDDGSPVINDNIMSSALEFSRKLALPVIDHCENTRLSSGWDMNGGPTARKLGLRGMPIGSEESMIERDIDINRKVNGNLHIAHVSTIGSMALIRKAKKQGVRITCEVTPNHLLLNEDKVLECNTQAKVNPPLRTKRDIESLIAGINDGTIDIIATDHAPHSKSDKDGDFAAAAFGISTFETALGSLINLVSMKKMTLNTVIAKLTVSPVNIINCKLPRLGTLETGSPADITIFDPDESWLVDSNKFLSKGKNTPLEGELLKGKVKITIFEGEIVYRDVTFNNIQKVYNE